MVTYKHKGIEYEIVGESAERLLSDFKYCESIGDWKTIQNRIINGTMWGWLKKINNDKI
jgi:hypothetical protein